MDKPLEQSANLTSGHLFTTVPLDLDHGWHGLAVIIDRENKQTEYNTFLQPTMEQLRLFLQQLVSDQTRLSGYTVLKFSKTGEVCKAQCDTNRGSINVVCKQNRPIGLMKNLLQWGRTLREQKNFKRGLSLWRAGIGTARPLAYIKNKSSQRRAWLITEFLPDLLDLDQWLLSLRSSSDPSQVYQSKKSIIHEVVNLFITLQRHGWHHRDLKASNLLLRDCLSSEKSIPIHVVDLDGLRKCRWWSAKRRFQPVVRLAASLRGHPSVTRSDAVRFLQAYIEKSGCSIETWKAIFRTLDRRVSHYLAQAMQRKHHKLDGYTGDRPEPSL